LREPLHWCSAPNGTKCEERIENTLIRQIELLLKTIEKLVQASVDDLLDVRVRKLGAQLTKRCSAKLRYMPIGVPEIWCRASFAAVKQ
jgi:hypothetical protein